MKAIVVGCGRQGALLAQLLEQENIEVVVVDNNLRSFTRLEEFKGKKILGDGMKEQTLIRAGIEDADAFAAVTNSDNINLISAQIARGIFKVKRVVCRVYDPHRAVVYSDLGLDTVNYSKTGAQLLKNYIINPEITKKYPMGDGSATTIEFEITKDFEGKKVPDLNIPGVFHCASIIRGLKVIIADPDVEVVKGDRVFGVALVSKLKEILEHFGINMENKEIES